MLNHIVIQGRLTADPELRTTSGDVAVASCTLAVEQDYVNKASGERGTDFINVVAWRGTATFLNKYFVKGQMAIVDGRLQIRTYKDKDGISRRIAEIVAEHVYFAGPKSDKDRKSHDEWQESATQGNAGDFDLLDEDGPLPF